VTILVDAAIWAWRGRRFAHLVSDESYDELHAFAARLGLPSRAFHNDHYDIPADCREEAVALGAEPVDPRQLVRRLRASGLRKKPGQLRSQVGTGGGLPPVPPPLGRVDPRPVEQRPQDR
jgi:hypothetical protein